MTFDEVPEINLETVALLRSLCVEFIALLLLPAM